MVVHDAGGSDTRADRLASIERLLAQYRDTKDRELLRQAIELWDRLEAERTLRATSQLLKIH
jgi:hypothetical protein